MDHSEARQLAQKITDYLFRNGDGDVAERLQLILPPDGRDGGGWGKGAMTDRIAEVVVRHFNATQ